MTYSFLPRPPRSALGWRLAYMPSAHIGVVRPLLWSSLLAVVLYGASVFVSDFDSVAGAAKSFDIPAWCALIALAFASLLVRFYRWQFYLSELGYKVPLGLNLAYYIGGFAFTLTPGKAGELVRSL